MFDHRVHDAQEKRAKRDKTTLMDLRSVLRDVMAGRFFSRPVVGEADHRLARSVTSAPPDPGNADFAPPRASPVIKASTLAYA
jgi:hypothetical protein